MINLGISFNGIHDSAACIYRDGKLLFAIEEERLSRLKHDWNFPRRSIKACLEFTGIKAEEIDHACIDWPAPRRTALHDVRCVLTGKIPFMSLHSVSLTWWARMRIKNGEKPFRRLLPGFRGKYVQVDHHRSHALSAYGHSGFDDAAILIIDGRGAWEATSIWKGKGGRMEHVQTWNYPNSLGLFYAALTKHLGFTPYSDEWKVMGLAPYGNPGISMDDLIQVNADGYTVNARAVDDILKGQNLPAELGPPREPESEIAQSHKDLAWAVQDACERAMIVLVDIAVKKTGSRNLCMAGGVALNSKANGKIEASKMIDRFFGQPAAADDGACLGAALAPYLDNGGAMPMHTMRSAYLGPAFTDDEIEKVLKTFKLSYAKSDNVHRTAAQMVADGKIVGWFQGRMEFGPRALGHRSIIADTRDPQMKEKVNNVVKFREDWRPFAPSMLAEAAKDYLESGFDSPFMILTAKVRKEKQSVIPAVTHADGTARQQTVEKSESPDYWRLIDEFRQITGVPVVMNTSFNLRGEAIVTTPADAIRTFYSCGMDALFLGPFYLDKTKA